MTRTRFAGEIAIDVEPRQRRDQPVEIAVRQIGEVAIAEHRADRAVTAVEVRGPRPAVAFGVGEGMEGDRRLAHVGLDLVGQRTAERSVGKACVSTCRSRGWRYA